MGEGITQKYLRECLDYTPGTGVFVWKERPKSHFKSETSMKVYNSRDKGRITGTPNHQGYMKIQIDGTKWLCHHLAWLYVNGCMPQEEIDHINGDPSDNRIANLRLATRQENNKNQKRRLDNKSGVTGVCWSKQRRKWVARINVNGKRIYIGFFDEIGEAALARKNAERLYGYHPNHGRVVF